MKKGFLTLLILFIFTATAMAGSVVTSGKQTSSAVVYAGSCKLTFIKLVETGADATLTLYDSATAETSGKKVIDYLECKDADSQAGGSISNPVNVDNGIYAVLTGSGAYYFIHVEGR